MLCHTAPRWTGPHCALSTSVRVWKVSWERRRPPPRGGGGTQTSARLWGIAGACISFSKHVCVLGRLYVWPGLCDSRTHTHAHMHTLTLKQPKFEIQNKCDKSERWRGEREGRRGGGWEGASGKCKSSLWGDKETSKEKQNQKRYGREMGLKH